MNLNFDHAEDTFIRGAGIVFFILMAPFFAPFWIIGKISSWGWKK